MTYMYHPQHLFPKPRNKQLPGRQTEQMLYFFSNFLQISYRTDRSGDTDYLLHH